MTENSSVSPNLIGLNTNSLNNLPKTDDDTIGDIDKTKKVDDEKSLDHKIEETARRYHFGDLDINYALSKPFSQENKTFLTMLDEYVSRSGYQLPDKKLQVLDFGAGRMPYCDGYITFLSRFGLPEGATRLSPVNNRAPYPDMEKVPKVTRENGVFKPPTGEEVEKYSRYVSDRNSKDQIGFAAWEGDLDASGMGGKLDWILKGPLDSQEQFKSLIDKGYPLSEINVLTMFGCGPSTQNWDSPKGVTESYGKSISILSEVMPPGSLLIITTSVGGPKKQDFLKFLSNNDFEILLSEENIYRDKLGDNLGFSHDEIIIARKKATI